MEGLQPTTIPDQPIPLLTGGFTPVVGQSTDPVVADSGSVTPQTHVNTKFPVANVAQETISQSLNTETKRILANYTFETLGAFQINSAVHPLANIKMSGEGIVATDANGNTTFSLDGETGDAIFQGTVEASGFTIADSQGLISLNNFESGEIIGVNESITSTSLVPLTGLSIDTSNFTRSKKVILFFETLMQMDASDHSSAYVGSCEFVFYTDGNQTGNSSPIQESVTRTAVYHDNTNFHFVTMFHNISLGTGVHTIQVYAAIDNTSGSGKLDVGLAGEVRLSYIVLGN